MRTLVEQTRDNVKHWLEALRKRIAPDAKPGESDLAWLEKYSPVILMGGEEPEPEQAQWDLWPEKPAVLIGTQDMLLSRALNRGYGMNRYRWPMHFGLLNNDCLWVMDETQLMGPALWTSAQMDWMRVDRFQAIHPCFTWWMSATIRPNFLDTLDRQNAKLEPPPEISIGDDPKAVRLLRAQRPCGLWQPRVATGGKGKKAREAADPLSAFFSTLAARIDAEHEQGTLSLVVCNTVAAAQALYAAVARAYHGSDEVILLRSRFRRLDRDTQEEKLIDFEKRRKRGTATAGLICISTQVVEAGVDISARRLWSEIAPWASTIQRLGRLNRDGQLDGEAKVWFWKTPAARARAAGQTSPSPYLAGALKDGEDLAKALAAIYENEPELTAAEALRRVATARATARKVETALTPALEPFPRAFDVHGLFSTEPDLFGGFTDISPFVRNQDPNADVTVFWRRDWDEKTTLAREEVLNGPAFQRDEGCGVSVFRVREFLGEKRRPWFWDDKAQAWRTIAAAEIRPGMLLMLPASAGGYDPRLGWTCDPKDKLTDLPPPGLPFERFDDDRFSQNGHWVELGDHLADAEREALTIVEELALGPGVRDSVVSAASLHDIGKSLSQWQSALPQPAPDAARLWAKGPYVLAVRAVRTDFNADAVETVLGEKRIGFCRVQPWLGPSKKEPVFRWQTDRRLGAKTLDSIREIPGVAHAWNVQFRPGLRHEAGSALALWHGYYRSGKIEFPALTIYLIAAHHGKVRTVLTSRSIEGDDVCGVPKATTHLPWHDLPLDFECAADGAAGHFSDDGTQFIYETPGWTALVSDLLGGWEGASNQPTCGAVPDGEPASFGPFALAYLETLVRCADERASAEPSRKLEITGG